MKGINGQDRAGKLLLATCTQICQGIHMTMHWMPDTHTHTSPIVRRVGIDNLSFTLCAMGIKPNHTHANLSKGKVHNRHRRLFHKVGGSRDLINGDLAKNT